MNHQSDHKAESFIEEKVEAFKESFMWVATTNGTLEQDCDIMADHFERALQEQQARFKKLIEDRKALSLDIQAKLAKSDYDDEDVEGMMERANVRITELDSLLKALEAEL